MCTSILPPAGPFRAAFFAALLGTLTTTAPAKQTVDPKSAAPGLPLASLDSKMPPSSPTIKNGLGARDNSHLSLEERSAMDAAASERGSNVRSADLQGAMDAGTGPFAGDQAAMAPTRRSEAHLQFDIAADGTLWAFGGTYKASFNGDGATYIPFLGSDAPRNFPVTFRAPEITINGSPIDTLAKADPVFANTTAVFDRGAVRELYDVRKGELEQLFVFDELKQRGEIVVRTPIDSELVGREGTEGLEFAGEHGSVGYSTAIAIDGEGRRSPVSTRYIDGEVELRVPADFVDSAALPLTIDPILTTFGVAQFPLEKDTAADIAYDGSTDRWMVVWQRLFSATDNDVFAQAYTADGALVGASGAYVNFASSSWSSPRIANNGLESQFLIVATVAGSTSTIWGRTREAENTTMGSPFQISAVFGDSVAPDVGGDPALSGQTYYMVAWERQFSFAVDHDIIGQLVTVDGTLPSGAISIDNTSGTYDKVPSVSKSAGVLPFASQRWNIVWQRQFTPTDWDIQAAQYRSDGSVIRPSFPLNTDQEDDRWPQASSVLDEVDPGISRQWLAVWERRWSDGVDDLHAAVMEGHIPQSQLNLSALLGTGEGEDQARPSVDTNGLQFAVTWTQTFFSSFADSDSLVAGVYIAGDDLYVSEGPIVLATGAGYQGRVQACARHSGGITSDWVSVVWQAHQTNGNHHIRAGVYECLDHYSHIAGVNYCGPAIPNSTGQSARINASGSAVAGPEPLVMTAWNMPSNVFGYIIGSPISANVLPSGTNGRICVGNPLSRFNGGGLIQSTGTAGTFDVPINTESIPSPSGGTTALTTGQTFHFQAWFRDGNSSNLTDGVEVLFH